MPLIARIKTLIDLLLLFADPRRFSDHFDDELIESSRNVQHGRASHHSTHPLPINQSNGWALAWHMPQSEGLCEIYCSIQLHLQSRLKGCSHSSNDEWLEILINNFPGRRFAVSVGGGKKLRSMCHPRKHCCSSNPSQFQLKAHISATECGEGFRTELLIINCDSPNGNDLNELAR